MPHLKVNKKLEPLVLKHKPIKVAIGGRGSGKSIGFGDIFTFKMDTEAADIYCLREYQDSVQDSVHRVFKDSIQQRLKLQGWQIMEKSIVAPNGARTTYKGANRNPDSMQSAQGYKYSWFEEAHRASKDSLDKLLPTIIRNPGAECWFSANPQSSADPFSQRLIVPYLDELERNGYYEDEVHLIVVVNWRHNPWWNVEQERLRLWDFENRPRAEYDWIWEGKFYDTVENAIILPEWFDAAVDAHKKLGFKAEGVRSLAFDPADEGSDYKATAFRHGVVVTKFGDWKEGDVSDATDKAFEQAFGLRATDFVYDTIGVGSVVKDNIARKDAYREMRTFGFVGGERVRDQEATYIDGRKNKDVFKNLRAQFYWYLRDRFEKTYRAVEKGEYIDPDELISIAADGGPVQRLRAEMCRIGRKRRTAHTHLQIESKEDMKADGRESPNMADAVMMAFANEPPPSPAFMKPLNFDTKWVV